MRIEEQVPLASITTFKVGGAARYVLTCESIEDVQTALAFTRERGLSWYVLGGGSNVLASDTDFGGAIIRMHMSEFEFSDEDEIGTVLATAGAGVVWDEFVQMCATRGLWGIENLAGIPGTVGAAPVQNIGAYGADVSQTIREVEVLDVATNKIKKITNEACEFAYRDSVFKRDANVFILRVTFMLSTKGIPHVHYADLAAKQAEGAMLDTPEAIAETVRSIRAYKFPDLSVSGTAGSFFKNPTIPGQAYELLLQRYPELPGYLTDDGVKLSLAWVLDKILSLRGYSRDFVRCFERQPLVIVSENGATAADVDAFANDVAQKVFDAIGIRIEREVRMLEQK